jgi:hypothetical protein
MNEPKKLCDGEYKRKIYEDLYDENKKIRPR